MLDVVLLKRTRTLDTVVQGFEPPSSLSHSSEIHGSSAGADSLGCAEKTGSVLIIYSCLRPFGKDSML